MKNKFYVLLTMGVLMTLSGCTTRLIDFTMISTKNVDLSKASTFKRGNDRIQGEDKSSIIFIIPTGVPNLKEAIDTAIESVPGGVALVDGVVSYKYFWIPYIYGEEAYVVEGTPLIDPQLASAPLSKYMIAKLDSKGELTQINYVKKDEYAKLHKKYFSK